MKFVRGLMLCLLAIPMLAQAATVDQTNPYKMMNTVSAHLFGTLKAEQTKIKANPEQLRVIVKQELLPYINTRYAAYKVLGSNLRNTTAEQRDAFTAAFTDYLVASYAQVLTQYTDQKIELESPKPVPADRSIISVRVDIVGPQRPPIRLDFKLRLNKKTKEWQGFDMVAEGVSMLSTKQSEWSGQLRTKGIDAVTQSLRDLAAKPIQIENN
ncbi:phospholipid-binding protein MlaC [Photobacterium carnosum]|jgi:phospholipid transport system substrate-binding protein|uniref:Phospholipid-binding protein MlaC n=1 Tax=Photobacterium carnosum TaxID=2023717 RepID=A0A2N4UT92_9GAMM|nr:phospholipid-binding protein MlaC [Photobacterium carnosum]KAE8176692.1 phospholipid-binding protein MlaC [Photobacterium carnosum]MBY3788461.1 phospholipid-binding protein MlaC [Photobacterium carnosum]MCD9494825.1 phospholipid-binding protein MlaC [Photobacterium carnosum]MCD9499585.1 phospholipid-binding protein MlaC [Photobacterium carnosum]MCD9526716.1 phospholipid-binding protein MlaC [Photobacterium carnosum]